MDLDDFDDLDKATPSQVPSRVSRFLPKSSKLVPKPEPPPEKAEPQQPKKPKTEDNFQQTTSVNLTPKTEPSVSNGDVKLESKPVPEPETEPRKEEPVDLNMDELHLQDDEDMIVREIDVFFTPSIDADSKLYVMQYPLRPLWRPYELDERCEEVRVKPSTSEVEMDLSIDVDSNNWDSEKASRLSMPKQTLSTTWMPPQATGYAVGVLIGNKLHLNPIHAVVQLRTSMGFLKSGGSKWKNNVASEIPVKLEDSNQDKSVGSSKKQINITILEIQVLLISAVQNKRMGSIEQRSNEEECWVPLKYHGSKSDFSARYLQRMLVEENSPIHFTMNPYDYVSSLCPGAGSNNTKSKGPSRRFLLSMPLEERFKKLLCEGEPVQRFSTLMHFAPNDTVEDVIGVLHKNGLLVQGLWAPRSPLLFNNDKMKCLARDYVLLSFSKNSVVKFQHLSVSPKLRDHIKCFLNIFAVERPDFKDWKFRQQTDLSFIKEHPNIVIKQEQVWAAAEKQITDVINKLGKSGSTLRNDAGKSAMVNKHLKAINSSNGPSGALTGNKNLSNESREALPKALQKLFQIHKVCSLPLIKQGLRDLAVSQSTLPKADARMTVLAAEIVDSSFVDTQEFAEVISQVATNIHGFYVSKSSEDPQHGPLRIVPSFRKVVTDLLLAGGPDAKLKKADVVEAARHVLKREISNAEYSKVMSDICESKGSAWILKKPK
ncbi:SIN-like family protein [Citrus sinensis]|uniref:SIN-like family protein n=1 Tax=Citrus sinensis TaxID=2711 RepID=A0ACB8J1C0_CITSI|nr:SIN-like family protein [Citrus sinensis]